MSVNRRLETVEGRKLQLTEKPLPATPPQGLIVKIHYAGICHSDLHFWKNTLSLSDDLSLNAVDVLGVKFPFVLGHEISGEVHELGTESCDGDTELTVGDKVIVYPWIAGCEPVCDACKLGQQSLCSSKNTLEAIIGLKLDGGWQTFVAVPKRYLVVKVPDGIGLDVACMTACSGITAYNAVYRIKDHIESVTKNYGSSSVIIYGVGGVGMWAVSMAKALLPASTNIIAMGVSANKLEIAKKLGAKETLLVNTAANDAEFIAPVLQATAGGADAILDCYGLGSTANRLVNSLSKGGCLVLVGLAGGTLHLSMFSTVFTRKTITSSLVGDKCQLISVLQLLSDNKVQPPPIEYCKLDAHDVSEVFHRMENNKLNGRVIIKVVE